MFIVNLRGGMGNNLFQIAFGKWLEARYAESVMFDFWPWNLKDINNSFIKSLIKSSGDNNIPPFYKVKGISRDSIESCRKWYARFPFSSRIVQNKYNYFYDTLDSGKFNRKGPYKWKFWPGMENLESPCYFDGYWQVIDYAEAGSEYIEEHLKQNVRLSETSEHVVDQLMDCKSVGIHVRLGDYRRKGWELPLAYYQSCIDKMIRMDNNLQFFVFSDEINGIYDCLEAPHLHYMDHQKRNPSIEDFYLLYRCDNHIISRSTFSWWAAFLNNDNSNITMAPSVWLKNKLAVDLDLYPSDWVIIPQLFN